MDECPHCHRKLLSKASARCNWCGEMIEDAAYQQNAQTQREAFYNHEAERDAITLARTESIIINPMDRMLGPLRPSLWRKPTPTFFGSPSVAPTEQTAGLPDMPEGALSNVPEPLQHSPQIPVNRPPLASNWPDSASSTAQNAEGSSQPWYAVPSTPAASPGNPVSDWPDYKGPSFGDGYSAPPNPNSVPPVKEPTGRFEHLEIDPK